MSLSSDSQQALGFRHKRRSGHGRLIQYRSGYSLGHAALCTPLCALPRILCMLCTVRRAWHLISWRATNGTSQIRHIFGSNLCRATRENVQVRGKFGSVLCVSFWLFSFAVDRHITTAFTLQRRTCRPYSSVVERSFRTLSGSQGKGRKFNPFWGQNSRTASKKTWTHLFGDARYEWIGHSGPAGPLLHL